LGVRGKTHVTISVTPQYKFVTFMKHNHKAIETKQFGNIT